MRAAALSFAFVLAAPALAHAEERDLAPAQTVYFPPAATTQPDDEADEAPNEPRAQRPRAPDPARDAEAEQPVPEKLITAGGFDLQLTFGPTAPPLGHVYFSGGGKPIGLTSYQTYSARGEQIGLSSPTFWGGEIALRYNRRYLAVGVIGAIGYGGTIDTRVFDATNADRIDRTHMNLYSAALELAGVIPLDPVSIRVGPVGGVRHVVAPLPGFEPKTCTRSSRYGSRTYSCPETATATTPFVQPRVTFDITLGKGSFVPAIGGYVGLDVYPATAWSGGISLSLRVPYWDLAP